MSNETENTNQSLPNDLGNISTAKMIQKLKNSGHTFQSIADAIGSDVDAVTDLSKNSSSSETDSDLHGDLFRAYLKDRIKAGLKSSPYLGVRKLASRLQVSEMDVRAVYDSMIRSGEVSYDEDTPDWSTTNLPMRKHIVPE